VTTMTCACCTPGGAGLFSVGGPDHEIEVDGRRIKFEMHRWSGPAVLDSHGDIAHKQPGPNHKFWTAVTLWGEQGRHGGADGLCVWTEPVKPVLVHLVGRNYAEARSALALKYGRKA